MHHVPMNLHKKWVAINNYLQTLIRMQIRKHSLLSSQIKLALNVILLIPLTDFVILY